MALNPLYIWLPVLQQNFVDKDTNLPLSNGYILFFSDDQRTVGKQVFMITGSPPNYSYLPLGFYDLNGAWRVDLLQDGAIGNALYFYPYTHDGNIENYFVQVYSEGDVLQFSLEAIPNLPAGEVGNVVSVNYVANPQFAINYPPNPTAGPPPTVEGEITQDITPIAPGGWFYQRSVGSTAKDIITFPPIGYVTSPPQNPKFYLDFQCVTPDGGDTQKDIALKFFNVNKFASTVQQYTFGFFGHADASLLVQLYLVKNFGTGGVPSPTTYTLLHTFTLGITNTNQFFSFLFGANTGITLGTNNDDYLELALRFPNQAFEAQLTDVVLTLGHIDSPILPDLPDDIYFANSMPGYMPTPAPDGSDLFLPIVNSRTGYRVDTSSIGQIIASLQSLAPTSYLAMDGTQYKTSDASSDGIPYARLQAVLYDATVNCPIFGTGSNFVTNVLLTSPSSNIITQYTNKQGPVTLPANGTTSPGFTFAFNNAMPVTTPLVSTAYYGGTSIGYIQNNTAGLQSSGHFDVAAPFAAGTGTSPFAVHVRAYGDVVKQVVEVNFAAGSLITAGQYFYVKTPTDAYYVWYRVNGAGADPAPAGFDFGLQVDVLSVSTDADVARLTVYAINSFSVTSITTVAAASIPQSAYYTFNTLPANNYYVWFNTNGGGTDPAIVGSIGIEVDLLGSETAPQVASKIMIAINNTYFSIGNILGATLRQLDSTASFDPDVASRFMQNALAGGAILGSFQFDSNQNHGHNFYPLAGVTNPAVDTPLVINTHDARGSITDDIDVNLQVIQGAAQSRGYNMAVNFFIKY